MSRWWFFVGGAIVVCAFSNEASAQSVDATGEPVTIAWDANPDPSVMGYQVYVGTSSHDYTQIVDVGNRTTFTFANGVAGHSYYFAVSAYADGHLEGPQSDEISTVAEASENQEPSTPAREPTPAPAPAPEPAQTPDPAPTPDPESPPLPPTPEIPPPPTAMAGNGGACGPLSAPGGRVIAVTPRQVTSLFDLIRTAAPGDTIVLADGTYRLSTTLVIATPHVTLRSASGSRDAVVLDAQYAVDTAITIAESNVTVADLTIAHARQNGIRVAPDSHSTVDTLLHNIRVTDAGGAFVDVAPANGYFADNGVLECSSLELTARARTELPGDCGIAGIRGRQAANWQIDANAFAGFWCSTGVAGPAIAFAEGSRGTIVDRNTILNAALGIVLGASEAAALRSYTDQSCAAQPDAAHVGGTVINNAVAAFDDDFLSSDQGFAAGIVLEQSCGTNVLHNTVVSTAAPREASIEWRGAATSATIANNLASHELRGDNARAVTVGGNLGNAPLSLFVDAANGNLHLARSAARAIDRAAPLSNALTWDLDGAVRIGSPDIGADEFAGTRGEAAPPARNRVPRAPARSANQQRPSPQPTPRPPGRSK